MSQQNDDAQPVIILYEVFTGTQADGTQVMVQIFRKRGDDKSMFSQIAFRQSTWDSWGPPIRLDDRHQISANIETPS